MQNDREEKMIKHSGKKSQKKLKRDETLNQNRKGDSNCVVPEVDVDTIHVFENLSICGKAKQSSYDHPTDLQSRPGQLIKKRKSLLPDSHLAQIKQEKDGVIDQAGKWDKK